MPVLNNCVEVPQGHAENSKHYTLWQIAEMSAVFTAIFREKGQAENGIQQIDRVDAIDVLLLVDGSWMESYRPCFPGRGDDAREHQTSPEQVFNDFPWKAATFNIFNGQIICWAWKLLELHRGIHVESNHRQIECYVHFKRSKYRRPRLGHRFISIWRFPFRHDGVPPTHPF